MPPIGEQSRPRNFFLNEKHELAPVEIGGGGAIPKYSAISWAAKAERISQSLQIALEDVKSSRDPLKDDRYFLLTQPVLEVEKRREDREGKLKHTYKEKPDFGGSHGKVFDRLGLDLLQVAEDGRAIVHAVKPTFQQLLERSATLDKLGRREQSRWAMIDSFGTIPLELRVDADWLKVLRLHEPADVVIELQPVLTRVEADRILRVIADLLVLNSGEKLTGTGTDFSGRHWFRGRATQRSVRRIAKDFFSVQAIHSPLYSLAAGKVRTVATFAGDPDVPVPAAGELPCVAVVDLGVPSDHRQLTAYKRGQFIPQDVPSQPVGDHGSFVASRVVFGDCDTPEELNQTAGQCTFYDAMVGDYPGGEALNRVNDKVVMEALRGVRGAAPDVRVFNLSFGDTRPLGSFREVERREKRLSLQDLDNFVFANDAIVVVAAGNSVRGVVPNPNYPDHHADGRWALGPWACGFNTLVCGSFVSSLSTSGRVKRIGWPSPFTRIGPGLCDAPVPSFGAPGGNMDDSFNFHPGLGVLGLSARGLVEDLSGTSGAAPLLAREAARTLHELQKYCLPGTRPFGVTARAFLTLTATPPTNDEEVEVLARRTLGYGNANARRLITPAMGSALVIWQGFIESPNDIVRVQLPIPASWLSEAEQPMLRLVVCYDPPVNEVSRAAWACRKVHAVLHLRPDTPGIKASRGDRDHQSYPVIDRRYKLAQYKPNPDNRKAVEGDIWLLELSYEQTGTYPPAMDFDPRQRVAFVAELRDLGESPADPQPAMQALPIAASMTRFSIQPVQVRTPILVRTR